MSNQQNPSVADALKAAIAAQLNALIAEGVSIRTLEKIQRFCAATRQALHAIETPEAKAKARFGGVMSAMQMIPNDEAGFEVDSDPYSAAPNIETYGANMPRQLMAMVNKLGDKLGPKPSAKDMVDAILAAEKGGKGDLAEMLRQHFVEKFGPDAKATAAGSPPALSSSNGATPSPFTHETTADAQNGVVS